MLNLLEVCPDITAIIAPQNIGVPGMLKAVRRKGLRVPEDISLIGLFSGAMSELITPPLSTLAFPGQEMGYQAARILMDHLSGELTWPQQVLLRPELIIRGSTGPAKIR